KCRAVPSGDDLHLEGLGLDHRDPVRLWVGRPQVWARHDRRAEVLLELDLRWRTACAPRSGARPAGANGTDSWARNRLPGVATGRVAGERADEQERHSELAPAPGSPVCTPSLLFLLRLPHLPCDPSSAP